MPPDGSVGADPATKVSAAFDEALNPSTVNQDTVQLRDPGGALVPAAVTYAPAAHTASLTPTARLAAATRYTATVTAGVEDVAGNALAALRTWSFTTASAAGPGPDGEPSETPPGTGPLGVSPVGLGAGLGTGTAATPVTGRPSPDRVAPRVRVSPRSTRVSRSGTAKLRVACPAGERSCRVTLRLRLAGRQIATRTLSVDGGRARTFALRLSRSARRALVRKRSLRVTAVAAARDFAGNRATTRTSDPPSRPGALRHAHDHEKGGNRHVPEDHPQNRRRGAPHRGRRIPLGLARPCTDAERGARWPRARRHRPG